ncbi:AAHS family 4-hydroxybenzoate transporter-like MFS transporter [Sphingobium sp. B2D3A]|uniref:MFS transporter n=1 Tax=unclassified Sphingobium TaxID=2611147 RepID=UPI002224110A|nr:MULTISPECIES: MFS transporter [unclassified Sphingobium]MCW2336234.1 AAHS family 4-hydroxybenzoate transporter-like MFS transporter [Sphingobium sp. B2D3A]MCW2385989.1 AAHS family 4-hydroxybenzoate transporter-like MFS transporter [Sphingobium sp. B2D3D]
MASTAATTFSAALASRPVRRFQWITVGICLLILVSDGIDMQLLGIVAPLVIADFGVDRGTFGIAMSAALIGFGLGGWLGGMLGDRIGRRYALAFAAIIFGLGTIAAGQAGSVTSMALWRLVSGIGFGAAYSNALTMASEWLPDRLRPITVSSLSVGTPIGGAVVGWVAPALSDLYSWRWTFMVFGIATLFLIVLIIAVLRDSPSFLIARGRKAEAQAVARRVLDEDIDLMPERHRADDGAGVAIGVLHRSNLRMNIGVCTSFTACALVAYGILNWSTTFLTAAGFTLPQAGNAVSVAGITSMIAAIAAGFLSRRLGTRTVMSGISIALFLCIVTLGFFVETLSPVPTETERLIVVSLIGASAAAFSGGIATMYVIMTHGYPPSCRSSGIGFGIFMSRVGAVSASAFGGALLELGNGSVIPFFAVLAVGAILVSAASFIVDQHMPPAGRPVPLPA